jgi:LmbE family N-acetylglucosaminyl deacetylase
MKKSIRNVALIVAHPDDETLWAGGMLLRHPHWCWFVVCLSRKNDPGRAPRFARALRDYGAHGIMGDLDDGPEQTPLSAQVVESTLRALLPERSFDLVLTHNPTGEYTKHLRHEEVSRAVIQLWVEGQLQATELRTFAYEDGDRSYFPRAQQKATLFRTLSEKVWHAKLKVMTQTYGFKRSSWETNTTPRCEAFWKFGTPAEAQAWVVRGGQL